MMRRASWSTISCWYGEDSGRVEISVGLFYDIGAHLRAGRVRPPGCGLGAVSRAVIHPLDLMRSCGEAGDHCHVSEYLMFLKIASASSKRRMARSGSNGSSRSVSGSHSLLCAELKKSPP